ncbi:hypothetical protein [Nocardioides sp. REDSEA-S30_B4]|jgi:AcrR family transcriptional regulator|uniref:hypothetical protein n=1 Tax=Nocardioides sp. REDSEA-S30_B4 TaxID=1811552 RepID=UPI000AB850FD|nr:hypothetical protein [Nocardioides sp. REDSEA-S30_B4]
MPAPLDTTSRTATLARAAFRVVLRDGLGGPALRAIAREARLSAATILHQLESRERLLRLTTHYACDTIASTQRFGVGAVALVPGGESVDEVRIWCQWSAYAEGDDLLSEIVQDQRTREQLQLRAELPWMDALDAELMHLAIEGARQAMSRRAGPLDPEAAERHLRRLEGLLADAAELRSAS